MRSAPAQQQPYERVPTTDENESSDIELEDELGRRHSPNRSERTATSDGRHFKASKAVLLALAFILVAFFFFKAGRNSQPDSVTKPSPIDSNTNKTTDMDASAPGKLNVG